MIRIIEPTWNESRNDIGGPTAKVAITRLQALGHNAELITQHDYQPGKSYLADTDDEHWAVIELTD